MAAIKMRRGEATREAILAAAEVNFAENGFDGARIDAIAAASGFNKTLIFRYFGDKLGLYTAVLQRADRETGALLARVFAPLLEDESMVSDAQHFKAYLAATIGAFFDYMVEHPHLMRMVNWEQAEGWQTFSKIASQFEPDDFARLEALFSSAQHNGLLRPNLDVVVALLFMQQICWSVPASLPLYQPFLQGSAALAHIREQLIALLVAGISNPAG
jgi:TetR/AcrR family transcriptional regulator